MPDNLHKKSNTGGPLSRVGEGKGVRVLLTHPGTQHAPKLARMLQERGILYRYATGIAFPDTPGAWWWKAAGALGMEKLLLKRVVPGLPAGKLHRQPVKEAIALFRSQVLGKGNDEVFYPRNKAFQQQLPQRLIDGADAVIGFDTSSWILAERCRKAGKPFVLDVSIAHPLAKEKVFDRLRQEYPAWSKELAPKQPHLIEAELQEIEAANHIVVASAFTKKTYTDHGVPEGKITINPYGTDLKIPERQTLSLLPTGGSRSGATSPPAGGPGGAFLFFGSLSARKGFPWLCKVWKDFYRLYPNCRLLAAGYDNRPQGFEVPEGVEILGAIHPGDRKALFAAADVFVFPSFFEGFGQVILEAMVSGLPVITTTATAGPDLFGAADCGHIIEPGNNEALLQALEFFTRDTRSIAAMGTASANAATPFSWHAYGERWANVLEGIIDNG